MVDDTKTIPMLNGSMLKQLQRAVMQTSDRKDLDQLTRHTWRTYEGPQNVAALSQLQKAVEAKRDILKRGDPR